MGEKEREKRKKEKEIAYSSAPARASPAIEYSLSMLLIWMTIPKARMAPAQQSLVTCVNTMIQGVRASPMYLAISKPVQAIDAADKAMLAHSHLSNECLVSTWTATGNVDA